MPTVLEVVVMVVVVFSNNFFKVTPISQLKRKASK